MAVLLLAAAIPAALSAWLHPNKPALSPRLQSGEVTLASALSWEKEPLWIDARSREEFDENHIPGAVLLTEDEWEGLFHDLMERDPFDRPMVVYCADRACGTSHRVADRLRLYFGEEADVHVLHGGWQAWTAR